MVKATLGYLETGATLRATLRTSDTTPGVQLLPFVGHPLLTDVGNTEYIEALPST